MTSSGREGGSDLLYRDLIFVDIIPFFLSECFEPVPLPL